MGAAFGIEEEFFLLDSRDFLPRELPADLEHDLSEFARGDSSSGREMLACQVESATAICDTGDEALESLRDYRRQLKMHSMPRGLVPLASGTPPLWPESMAVAPGRRYAQIEQMFPAITREHLICGMHIHVGIPDMTAGLDALNTVRHWLPLLAALGANSPFWNGRDSGFASWRTVHYRRWSINGIPPAFSGVGEYEDYIKMLYSSDVVVDAGHISWAARLSERYPTLEVRVADTQRRPEEAVMLALLIRALVDTAFRHGSREPQLPTDLLELSLWQAAKHGLDGPYFDVRSRENRPTTQLLDELLQLVGPALVANGDEAFVHEQLQLMLAHGNGAHRQRESWTHGGVGQLVHDAAGEFHASRLRG